MYFDPTVMLPDSLNTLSDPTGDSTPKEFSMMVCLKKCPDVTIYSLQYASEQDTGSHRMCKYGLDV